MDYSILETGAEMIYRERIEQLVKHGVSVVQDVSKHGGGSLLRAAEHLLTTEPFTKYGRLYYDAPHGWEKNAWERINRKSHIERLVIAGALIAAEIDRIQYMIEHIQKVPKGRQYRTIKKGDGLECVNPNGTDLKLGKIYVAASWSRSRGRNSMVRLEGEGWREYAAYFHFRIVGIREEKQYEPPVPENKTMAPRVRTGTLVRCMQRGTGMRFGSWYRTVSDSWEEDGITLVRIEGRSDPFDLDDCFQQL